MPANISSQNGRLLWLTAYREGRAEDCLRIATRLCSDFPGDGSNWQLLGISFLRLANPASAEGVLTKACQLTPGDASIWDNLGAALQQLGRDRDAVTAIRRSLAMEPENSGGRVNLSNSLLRLGQPEEALREASLAVRQLPESAETHLCVGNSLSALRYSNEAKRAFREALRLQPEFVPALISLGREFSQQGNLLESVRLTQQALALAPRSLEAHVNLGRDLSLLGDVVNATAHYRAARQIDPHYLPAWSGQLYCQLHDDKCTPETLYAEHRAFGSHIEGIHEPSRRDYANLPDPDRPLRLGFVSADFRNHPVARFIEPIWNHLDHDQFELIAYDNQPSRCETAKRLRQLANHWVDISTMSDSEAAERIRTDTIDILFDLSGHTAGNRLGVFARKPAPVQATWIGYPGTTGLHTMDYRFVDAIAAPPGSMDGLFSECLAYLPVMSVFDRPENLPDVAPSPALSEGRLTFGSFNRVTKLGPATLELWARTLLAVPDARLLIGGVPNDDVAYALKAGLTALGITPERISLHARVNMDRYLRLHDQVDILLDSLPFSSGTTANFALWMGVPTLTLAGHTLAQRIGASRMSLSGLDDFIAKSSEEFVERAVFWSAHRHQLADLRGTLRMRMEEITSTLPRTVTDVLAERLRTMWHLWCHGLPSRTLT